MDHNCQRNAGCFDPHFNQNVLITENSDYSKLHNKPIINGVTLEGETSLTDLGLRAIQYADTSTWNDNLTLVSEEGVVYIYSDYKTVTTNGTTKQVVGIKIGDGVTYLVDLPYINGTDDIKEQVISDLIANNLFVSPEDRERWNGKINMTIDPNDGENLVFSVS